MPSPAATPGVLDAARRFDLAVQRAVGTGLAVALVHGFVVAIAGRALYPPWWWWLAPVTLLAGGVAVRRCLYGRFTWRARVELAAVVAASAVATAAAVGTAVPDVGTAVLSLVIVTLIGIGLLSRPVPAALLGGCVIVADTLAPLLVRPSPVQPLLTQTAIQSVFLVGMILVGRLARRVGAAEERAEEELAAARTADHVAAAVRAERRELEREMHDTVLNTLSALAQGGLDDNEAVRRRCAADVAFLTALRAEDTGTSLSTRLQEMITTVLGPGFEVSLDVPGHDPPDLPPEVMAALTRAAREALVNARRHSGARRASVRAHRRGEGVTVEISDSGRGGAAATPTRLGIRRSIAERMYDVGGHADVADRPGGGTTVTLRWPS